jgi:hypothetical protein
MVMSDAHGPGKHPGETHYGTRVGWLRAAVLGANDGLLSTSSLVPFDNSIEDPGCCRWFSRSIAAEPG